MYIDSNYFKDDFNKLFEHDKSIFNDPEGWATKTLNQSPLIINFDAQWESLKMAYIRELQKVAFGKIPDKKQDQASTE